ncbi:MAG: ABC transporter ATP-binding protein [Actinomyces urogenitalis]|uniref:ABC transporter ATP-binding protein n=1 Tax=Actinomyces urogenitalis TaxID=103621 RepID=UPI00242EB363|nr:ABC transporter ATP-binding protein [Actinomyces urogenitalis]MCI7456371.1 ABC transporter ATP-binding protein [Actinomyces urogenitalis]MDY3678380.1 ABC transporter ATP-binding protein [Actinomyces urogenitalis]
MSPIDPRENGPREEGVVPSHAGAEWTTSSGPQPLSLTIPPVPGSRSEAAVVVRHLTRRFGGLAALDDLSLTLPAGRVTGLMGSNGSGKTTLLKILAGVLSDYEGEVRVAGYAPGPQSKARASFLPDAAFLAQSLTVPAAIEQYARLFADFDVAKARSLVQHFTLPEDRTLKEMSKGMGEKLRIALTMSRRAEVYLLDEPISGVDPAAREALLDGILADFDPDALLLISTHLIADLEPVVDSAVFLRDGRLLLAGDADDLREAHGMGLDALFRKEYR